MTPAAISPSFASLQTTINRQLEQVTHGLKQGRLSKAEAERFTTTLSAFARELKADAFSGDGLQQGRAIAEQLNGLGQAISKSRNDDAVDHKQMLAFSENRIKHHLDAGHLSPAEAGELRAQMNNLKQQQPNGPTSAQSSRALAAFEQHVGQLDKRITELALDRHVDVDKRGAWMERRIANGVKDGSLTTEEATSLRAELSACRLSTHGGDPEALRSKMDALSRRIYSSRRNENTALFTRIAHVEDRIQKALSSTSSSAASSSASSSSASSSAATPGTITANQLGDLLSLLRLERGVSPGLSWFINTGDFKQADREFGALVNHVAQRLEQLLQLGEMKKS